MHGEFSQKVSVRPSTIGYMYKELQSICSDYDSGMAHSKRAIITSPVAIYFFNCGY